MTDTDLAYLSGLFDGEGCISILKMAGQHGYKSPRYRLRLQITNTNKPVMNWLNKYFNFYIYEVKKLKKHWKQCWKGFVHDKKAMLLLQEMLPYLKVKYDEAQIAIEFQQHKEAIGTSNGASGLTQEQLTYREDLKRKLSILKQQKI